MPKNDEICWFAGQDKADISDDRLAPVLLLRSGSDRYARSYGLGIPSVDCRNVVACAQLGRRIAAAYTAAPVIDRQAFPAYEAFRLETLRQFEFLTRPTHRGGLGVQVEISRFDPYPSAVAMTRDLREFNRIKVYATSASGNEHPFLTNAENDTFRAVHDAFGHAAIGRGFDADGEEAAWLAHSHMYSPLARQAMTTETRGQNAALIRMAASGSQSRRRYSWYRSSRTCVAPRSGSAPTWAARTSSRNPRVIHRGIIYQNGNICYKRDQGRLGDAATLSARLLPILATIQGG